MTVTIIKECRHCHRDMRPNRGRIADYPGTVAETANGLCITCYTAANHRKQERLIDYQPLDGDTIYRMAELHWPTADYILRRRARGIPAEGYRMREEA